MKDHSLILKATKLLQKGKLAALKRLVAAHPEILELSKRCHGLVWYCVWHKGEMLRSVLEMGFVPDEETDGTPLMHAAAEGKTAEMKLLLKFGANIKAKNRNGETAFGYALAWDQLGAVKVMIKAGADPREHYETTTGTTMYLQFAGTGDPAILKYLQRVVRKSVLRLK